MKAKASFEELHENILGRAGSEGVVGAALCVRQDHVIKSGQFSYGIATLTQVPQPHTIF